MARPNLAGVRNSGGLSPFARTRVTPGTLTALDHLAESRGVSRSVLIRSMLLTGLTEAGYEPHDAPELREARAS